MDKNTRLLPQQIRLARLQPATFNAETRTVEVVWTTGARVRRYNWWDDEHYEEELVVSAESVDLSRLASGSAPVLDSHGTYELEDQIGVVERAWIEGTEGRAVLRLSGREDVAGIVQDIRDGIICNISVGYSVERYDVIREVGKLPVYRAVLWTPSELSFVTVPADAAATTRSNPNTAQGKPCEFTGAIKRPITEEIRMDETDVPQGTDTTGAGNGAANPATTDVAAIERAAAQRAADITALATRHGMAEQAADWIRTGQTVEQVRGKVLDALARRDEAAGGHHNRVTAGVDQVDKHRAAAVEVLLSRAQVRADAGKVVRIAHDNPFRSYTLLDLARHSLEQAGVRTAGMSKMDLVGRAFTQSTSDFPVLLENAMHKTLQAAYAVAADSWSRWCSRGSVSDFRDHNRYRVGSLGNLDALNELGEFRNKTIPDGEKSQIKAGTKGNIINLSRKAIINDDLGAFLGLATAFGRAAGRTVEQDAYATLAANPLLEDGFALFSAEHANIGGSGALSVTTVDGARQLMALQKDVGGNDYLDLRPSIFVGPVALGGLARVINESVYDPDANNKLQRANMVAGLFRDIVDSPRLTGTVWYAFADPADAPVIEVAFLDGNDTPFLEMQDGFDVDGARWKVRLDYGVAAIDYRGAVRSPGA